MTLVKLYLSIPNSSQIQDTKQYTFNHYIDDIFVPNGGGKKTIDNIKKKKELKRKKTQKTVQ